MKLLVTVLILFFACATAAAQTRTSVNNEQGIVWLKGVGVGAIVSHEMGAIKTAPSGEIIAAGIAQQTNLPETNVFLQNITKDGAVKWSRLDADTETVWSVKNIEFLPNGNFFVGGDNSRSVDGNTGIPYYDSAGYVILYNAGGTRLWKRHPVRDTVITGFIITSHVATIAAAADGAVYACGYTQYIDKNQGYTDSTTGWIVKFNADGSRAWQRNMVTNGDLEFTDIAVHNNTLYVLGNNTPNNVAVRNTLLYTLDPATGTTVSENTLAADAYYGVLRKFLKTPDGLILAGERWVGPDENHLTSTLWLRKINYTENTTWEKLVPVQADEYGVSNIREDEAGGFVITGFITLDGTYFADAFLKSFTVLGNPVATKVLDYDATTDNNFDVLALRNKEYLLAGRLEFAYPNPKLNGKPYSYYRTDSLDLNSDHSGVLIKVGFYNTIVGTVWLDANNNGVKDASEYFADNITVRSTAASDTTSSATQSGVFKNIVTAGTYSTTPVVNAGFQIYPTPAASTFTKYFDKDSISFRLVPVSPSNDLAVEVVPLSPVRPGFTTVYRIQYANNGTTTIPAATVKLRFDSRYQYLTSLYGSPDFRSGDTAGWNIGPVLPLKSGSFEVVVYNIDPPDLNNGDTVSIAAVIEPKTTDAIPVDNTFNLKQIAQGSFDPNDKAEAHSGLYTQAQLDNGEYLNYLIRFQNTGTDTAFNIQVRDTLDTQLDWSTLQMVASSHPYSLQVQNGANCAWTFANIKLPDENINEPASHGFIAYRIKPKRSVPVNSVIHNTASIYFDFNLPVQTNDALTTIQGNSNTLPLKLLLFSGSYADGTVLLQWETADEKAFDRFDVQRSEDGASYKSIGAVQGRGTFSNAHYQFQDPVRSLAASRLYYRLKMVDDNGSFSYSPVVKLKPDTNDLNSRAYPNPAVNSDVSVIFYAAAGAPVSIVVSDLSGRVVMQQTKAVNQGYNVISIEGFSKLSPGTYVIRLSGAGKTASHKVRLVK